ncbi:hypothetical protein F5Y04DRAFT_289641 [Hypomontagnella monticulosa]|nr:hypothetical protein F5Y04DRAFT_289641 [Hypomontagnella monticulosa]
MSATTSPTLMQSSGISPLCQAIVHYHTCGCKSKRDPVRFCNKWGCEHKTSTLIVGELPFACESKEGPSALCGVEDRAKREFVREVDTAETLRNFMILPGVTKEDIESLIPPSAGSNNQSWTEEVYSQYKKRQSLIFEEIPRQNNPADTQETTIDMDLKDVDRDNELLAKLLQPRVEDMGTDHISYTNLDPQEDSDEDGPETSMENEDFGTTKTWAECAAVGEDIEACKGDSCESNVESSVEAGVKATASEIERDVDHPVRKDMELPEPAWFDIDLSREHEMVPIVAQPSTETPVTPGEPKDLYGETGEVTDDFIEFLATSGQADQADQDSQVVLAETSVVTGQPTTGRPNTMGKIPKGNVMGKIWSFLCVQP